MESSPKKPTTECSILYVLVGPHIGRFQATVFTGTLPKPWDEVVVCRKSDDNPQNNLHLIIVEMMNLREIRMAGCVLCMVKM